MSSKTSFNKKVLIKVLLNQYLFCFNIALLIIKYTMFDFIDDIRELKDIVMTFRYINYSNKYVIFEGTKDILFFDDKSIILKLKNGEIKVNGSNLMVCEIDSNYLAIKGNITSIESAGLL